MSVQAILASVWGPLRRVLLSVGRWVLGALAEEGTAGLVSYMRQRVRVFQRRMKRAHANLRREWLTGRIDRWKRAIKWLRGDEAKQLNREVIDAAMERADQEIPEVAPEESFTKWERLRAGRQERRAARRARRIT